MVVTRGKFKEVVDRLATRQRLSLDTETTGLRVHHGDRLFSIIIADEETAYYFNFQPYAGLTPDQVLLPEHLKYLQTILFGQPGILWYLHNAKYDLHILANDGCFLAGLIHCTKAIGRVVYNEHQDYSLAGSLERIGLKKDDAVEAYISEHGLWQWKVIPGKKARDKDKFYHKVPFTIVVPYGQQDGVGTRKLGEWEERRVVEISNDSRVYSPECKLPRLTAIMDNERRLTKTVFNIERRGLKIDRPYCERAAAYEGSRMVNAQAEFERLTGKPFKASGKLFEQVFADQKLLWKYTDKGNPSFESDTLQTFESPVAWAVLAYRDAKARSDFYNGFLYHADKNDVVHPTLNPDGTQTGRFSSSDPNFQNLTKEDLYFCLNCKRDHEEKVEKCDKCGSTSIHMKEFLVRRAVVPRPGFSLAMLDYDQMEYRLMLEYAMEMSVIDAILKEGLDVHQATANLMGVKRNPAKTLNFMLLYGGGTAKLCIALFKPRLSENVLKELVRVHIWRKRPLNPDLLLGLPEDAVAHDVEELRKAKELQDKYFAHLPHVTEFIRRVIRKAELKHYIINWAGRICQFPDPRFAYKAPNYLIQGGCADVAKIAMNRVDEMLRAYKSGMILQVHDELLLEVAEGEEHLIAETKGIMETVYPFKKLPLTAGIATSAVSWADKVEAA